MALRWGPSSQLFAATLVAALLGHAAATTPSGANCPASYKSYYPTATCCPVGYALTQLDVNSACQVFTCAGGNDATQCRVLGDWYYATQGPTWTAPSSPSFGFSGYGSIPGCPAQSFTAANFAAWAAAAGGTATDYSTFAYIHVDTNGNVACMYWNKNYNGGFSSPIGSTLPSSLSLLTSLVYLDINGPNSFSGSMIPNLNRSLASLAYLDLYAFNFIGSFPAWLGSATALKHLSLASLNLDGSLPAGLGSSGALTYLSLPFNKLTGSIPAGLANASALAYLNLDTNSLNGTIPDMFTPMTALTMLDLGSNQLTGTVPASVVNLQSLQCLYVNLNYMNGSLSAAQVAFFGQLNAKSWLYDCYSTTPQLQQLSGYALTAPPASPSPAAPSTAALQTQITALNSLVASQSSLLTSLQVGITGLVPTPRPSPPPSPPLSPPPSPPSTASFPPSPAVNLTSAGANLTVAAGAIAAQLSGASGAALASAQTSLLQSLAPAAGGPLSAADASTALSLMLTVVNASSSANGTAAPLSASTASTAATAVLAVVVSSGNSTLSAGAQSAALSVLSAVASAPINVSGSAGVAVVSALSSIAGSAAANNPGALAQVSTVLAALTSSAASSLLSSVGSGATASQSIVFSTAQIQAATTVTPPGVVSTSPISAPGSPSSFDALPPGVLSSAAGFNSSAAVITQFYSLAFDPYSSGNTSAAGSLTTVGGVTRLAFSTASGPLVVANATMPITFTLPAVNTSTSPTQHAVCAFYDTTAGAYSTAGCIALPNPSPAGHTLSFTPGYATPSDASLAGAWSITGPLVDQNCQQQVIDCSSDAPCTGAVWGRNCSVQPNQRQPLGAANAAISCPATGAPVLRVMYGVLCSVWQNNTLGCWWNNTKQSFIGPGCVSTPGPTQCMCRHLTDFAPARAPSLSTVSTSELLGLSPGDIITKLRLLFVVVITLFGIMLLGAAGGYARDLHHQKQLLVKLMDERFGFAEQKDGTWTWSLRQEPLLQPVGAPSGTAVNITEVFSIPFIRLRTALPEELLPGSLPQALGRRGGLSTRGLTDSEADHHAVFTALRRRASVSLPPAKVGPAPLSELPRDDAATLLGTALVFAFLSNQRVLPAPELAVHRASASAFFAGSKVHGVAHDFDALVSYFSIMLGFNPGSMAYSARWLENARLWRLILLQQADGGWELSNSLAFVAHAHAGMVAVQRSSTTVQHLARFLSSSDMDYTTPAHSGVATTDDDVTIDCPLTFSPEQLRAKMPPILRDQGPLGERLWATALACGVLGGFSSSWLVAGEVGQEKTILDAGRAYIDACLPGADAGLVAYISGGELDRCVQWTLWQWREVHDGVVAEVRSHKVLVSQWLFTHQQLTTSLVLKSLSTDHATFATFCDAESDLKRWQRFMLLVTFIVCSLLVSIWLNSSRGSTCCAEVRGLLDSGAGGNCSSLYAAPQSGPSSALLTTTHLASTCLASTPQGPCLGSSCDCGDLLTQFGTLPGAYVYATTNAVQCSSSTLGHPSCTCRPTLEDYTCHAFPDERVTDQLLVGLISVAVALPARFLLEQAFRASAQAVDASRWVVYTGWSRLFLGWAAHHRWSWRPQRPSDLTVWIATVYPTCIVWDYVAFLGWWLPKLVMPTRLYAALEERFGGRSWSAGWVGVLMLLCGPLGWLFLIVVALTYRARSNNTSYSEAEEPSCGGPDGQVRAATSAGVLAVLAVWAVYAWFIFTFGMQIYTRLGPGAEKTFAQSWCIGVGLDQAQQFKAVGQTVVQVAILVDVLDLLRIRGHSAWLEDAVDFASVQCMLFDGKARSWWQQTKELAARQYRSFGLSSLV